MGCPRARGCKTVRHALQIVSALPVYPDDLGCRLRFHNASAFRPVLYIPCGRAGHTGNAHGFYRFHSVSVHARPQRCRTVTPMAGVRWKSKSPLGFGSPCWHRCGFPRESQNRRGFGVVVCQHEQPNYLSSPTPCQPVFVARHDCPPATPRNAPCGFRPSVPCA